MDNELKRRIKYIEAIIDFNRTTYNHFGYDVARTHAKHIIEEYTIKLLELRGELKCKN